MSASQFDVIVVGGGAAGLTAAIALARAGFKVVVTEAASCRRCRRRPATERGPQLGWKSCTGDAASPIPPTLLQPEKQRHHPAHVPADK